MNNAFTLSYTDLSSLFARKYGEEEENYDPKKTLIAPVLESFYLAIQLLVSRNFPHLPSVQFII